MRTLLTSAIAILSIGGVAPAQPVPPGFVRQDIPVGVQPTSVVTADFDADGHLDLAVANTGSASVSILLGAGNGTFVFATDVIVAGQPVSLHTADLDHNGTADLVAGNTASPDITVLLGSGSGSFQVSQVTVSPEWVPGGGGAPLALETGDFNNDGHIDIASAIAWSNLVYVALGSGDGTFPTLIAPAAYVFDDAVFLVARDFNADGVLDLAVSHIDPYMAVVPGLGDGSFGQWDYSWAEPWSYPWPLPSWSIAAADVNGDDHVDIVRTDNSRDSDYTADGLSVHLADGAGGFLARTRIGSAANPKHVTTADFNGDGHADVAVANFVSGTVGVLLGDGQGNFPSAAELGTDAGPSGIATGDFNGDGTIDLAVANAAAGSISVLLNAPSGCGPDTTPPSIEEAYATPPLLWPPDRRLHPVTLTVTAADACSAAACRVIAVESSEGPGTGRLAGDWIVTGDLTLLLRSVRDGRGDGRVYTITVQCTDESGNASEQAVNVTVPHDARARRERTR